MSTLVQDVLAASPRTLGGKAPLVLAGLGVGGLGLGFFGGQPMAGWVALLVSTVVVVGLGMFGALLSAIFQMTNAHWGRPYRRLAEASAALMPLGLALTVIVVAGAGHYLPWLHGHKELGGEKAIWLARGFWSLRVLLSLVIAYGVGLAFLYYSVRRDFCVAQVRERYTGRLGAWLGRGIGDAEEQRCNARLTTLAPVVAIAFGLCFSMLGFDLIMALEPDWFSTLFGAWYFISHLLNGLALLATVTIALQRSLPLDRYLTKVRQGDLATLLLAFVLVNTDFFWSQYLTIWYSHVPEETGYVVKRTMEFDRPWAGLSYVSLACFFVIPVVALLFRRVKRTAVPLTIVALVVLSGVVLARFLEIAPALIELSPDWTAADFLRPLVATVLVLAGCAGIGWRLYRGLLTAVPIMAVNDPVFVETFSDH